MNEWVICFWIGLALLIGIPVFGFSRAHRAKAEEVVHIRYYLFAGVLASAVILLVPFGIRDFSNFGNTVLHVIVSSVNYVLQMFALNAPYKDVLEVSESLSPFMARVYTDLISVEFFAAPLLMFSIVAMFFRNATSTLNYNCQFRKNIHIFSELNEESLALAKSIKGTHKKDAIVFTDVSDELEEKSAHLIKKARDLHAICYRKGILAPNFQFHSPSRELKFYTISEDEVANIVQATELIERYRQRDNCYLYVFTSRPECEYLLNKKVDEKKEETVTKGKEGGAETGEKREQTEAEKKDGGIVARRINAISSLVNRILYENGCTMLYDKAAEGTPRKISAVLVGLGRHGMEMLKALSWFGLMYGYKVEINAFDKDPDIRKKLNRACGELFMNQDRGYSASYVYEPGYTINIYPGTDTESEEFVRKLERIGTPTYVLVALGDDVINIRTAVNLRMIFERINAGRGIGKDVEPKVPVIQSIVYNSSECAILKDINNSKGQKYEIDFIGDVESSYTEKVMINSDLEKDAEMIHREYSSDNSLLDYEYNFKSSCASAIHTRAVAWQLLDVCASVDVELMKTLEFWINLAHKYSDPKIKKKCTLDKDIKDELNDWSGKMNEFCETLINLEGFSFEKWGSRKLIDPEKLKKMQESIQSLNDGYNAFADGVGGLNAKPENHFNLGTPFTEKNIVSNKMTDVNTENAVYYCLLINKLMMLEHERWSAYMRADGYVFGKPKNDLGKIHNDLVPYHKLEPYEKGKDLHILLLIKSMNKLRELKNKAEQALENNRQGNTD